MSVPVDGDKFFGKHIAVVGSTGSGKSHSVATIIQRAVDGKRGEYDGLNNSHIVIFDIHSEYRAAFPEANLVDIANLRLPYWMLNSDELQELFIDTEANDHNQRNVFKEAVITSKHEHFTGTDPQKDRIHFDSPVMSIPAIVRIDTCHPAPASSDTPYWEYWQEPWRDLDVPGIRGVWESR